MKQFLSLKKLTIVALLCVVFFNCEKDEINITEETENVDLPKLAKVQTHIGNEVSQTIIDYIKVKTNNTLQVLNKKGTVRLTNTTAYTKSDALGTIDTSKEIVVINELNTKHTFKVIDYDDDNKTFVNLIVVETENTTYEYFVKYTLNKDISIYNAEGNLDFSQFRGRIETFNSEGDLTGDILIEDGSITTQTGQLSPCPDEPVDDTNTNDEPTDGDTTSSSSTNGNIPGTDGQTSGGIDNNIDNSSGGYFEGDNSFCGLRWSYAQCGCGGTANGHQPQAGYSCCQGSPLIITDCNGNIIAQRSNSTMPTMIKGNPSTPCDDGAVGVLLDNETDQKNCEELKKLLAETDYPIIAPAKSPKSAHEDLEGDLSLKHEVGYTLIQNMSQQALAYKASGINYSKVKYPTAANVYGGMHTHQDNNEIIPMFSWGDVKTLLDFYQEFDNDSIVDKSLFVHVVVTYQGTYAIKINDPQKLQQLNEIYADEDDANGDGVDEFEQFRRRYDTTFRKTYNETTGLFTGGSLDFQKAFLKFITQKYDLGVSLYKAEENTDGEITWKKKTLNQVSNNTSVVETTPCPE